MKLFCSVKGFGDFVVACRFLRHQPEDQYELLCAGHLKDLYDAIGAPIRARWIDLSRDNSFPAAYDVRRQGIRRALLSVLRIRHAIGSAFTEKDQLIFEQITARERVFAWPHDCTEIGRSTPNIYRSYASYFGCAPTEPESAISDVRSVAIFPDARLPHRVLRDELLRDIVQDCEMRGLDARIVRIGSASPGGQTDLPVEWIYGFEALVRAIRQSDAIISSDSLPGHLAEYIGRPIFIFTPKRKDYWLPGSVFEAKAFALFEDPSGVGAWLDRVRSGSHSR